MDIQKYVDELTKKALSNDTPMAPEKALSDHTPVAPIDAVECGAAGSLAGVLAGFVVELWSNSEGRLFLVSDEADAQRTIASFGARRGEIYTAAETRRIVAVSDPAAVAEIHKWKRQFDARLSDHQPNKGGPE